MIQPVYYHKGHTVALFLDDTLEVDVSIDDEDTRFAILGSKRTLPPLLVVGQTIVQI